MKFLKTELSFWICILLGFLFLTISYVYIDNSYFLPLILLSLSLFFIADVRENERYSLFIAILLLAISVVSFLFV